MDELNLIRDFRARAALDPAARERARAALRSAIAGRRAQRSRVVVVAATLTVLLVGGGSAYALAREFLVGAPAPADVKEQAARGSSGRPLIGNPPKGPEVRPEGMVLAASLESSVGMVYLWRAPSDTEDTICLYTQIAGTEQPDGSPNLGGGCGGGSGPIDSTFSGSTMRDGRWLSLVYGRVGPAVHRLVLELGERRIPIPLTGRFFLSEIEGVGPDAQPRLRFLGYDAAGRKVAEHEQPGWGSREFLLSECRDISGQKPALEILTRRTKKPIRAYAFERGGTRCSVLATPGGSSSGSSRPPGRREIPIGVTQIGAGDRALVLIWGEVGREIAKLELEFDDGRVERLPLADHVTLYQVAPDDYAKGRQPVKLIGRDAAGKVIAEQPLR